MQPDTALRSTSAVGLKPDLRGEQPGMPNSYLIFSINEEYVLFTLPFLIERQRIGPVICYSWWDIQEAVGGGAWMCHL